MNVSFTPHKEGNPLVGTLCLPCESSFAHISSEEISIKHPDWELIECPVCGQECYISDEHKKTILAHPDLEIACTQCALRGGAGKWTEPQKEI